MPRRRRSTGPVALPIDFVEELRDLVPADQHEALVTSFALPRRRLRVNRRKATAAGVERLLGIPLTPVPWCADAYHLPEGLQGIGAHPAHLAGFFYLQEPSATLAVAAAEVQPGDRVVDLAAAPGGKSLQLADAVGPEGIVIANEVARSRLSPLHDNLDLWGVDRVLTASTAVAALVAHPVWTAVVGDEPGAGADVVLLDAPCSGEALFRRSDRARREWSVNRVGGCVTGRKGFSRRADGSCVLAAASCTPRARSTCRRTNNACSRCSRRGSGSSCPCGCRESRLACRADCARVWPHLSAGEGQFVAVLERAGAATALPSGSPPLPARRRDGRAGDGPSADEVTTAWRAWAATSLSQEAQARLETSCGGARLAAVRSAGGGGLRRCIGVRTAGRASGRAPPWALPAAALATFLRADDVQDAVDLDGDDPRLADYLRGEEIADGGPDASVLVCLERWGLGGPAAVVEC